MLVPAPGCCQCSSLCQAANGRKEPLCASHASKTKRRTSVELKRPRLQLYVSKTKRKTAAALQLSPKLQQLLTQDHLASSLHAVHLRDTTLKRMHRILRHYRRRYSTLVAFVPSGQTGELPVCLGQLDCA